MVYNRGTSADDSVFSKTFAGAYPKNTLGCKFRCILPGGVKEPEIILNVALATPAVISEPFPCQASTSKFSLLNYFCLLTTGGLRSVRHLFAVIIVAGVQFSKLFPVYQCCSLKRSFGHPKGLFKEQNSLFLVLI